jgi:hypothetical protein
MKSASGRAQSVPPKPRNVFGANAKSATSKDHFGLIIGLKVSSRSVFVEDSGAVDEDQFREAFNDYAAVTVSSGSDLENELMKINVSLSNPNEDWEKRIEQVWTYFFCFS